MAIIDNLNEVLHKIKVRLYPNYLSTIPGAYIARTVNEDTLTVEEICAALKNRGGFTGSYDDLVEHTHQFLNEAAYQLCDGFAVDMRYYSVHPNVGGTFDKATERHDPKKHPVTFRFHPRAPLRTLAEHVVVEVEGVADASGYIDEFIDVSTGSVNEALTPGGQFSIAGHKVKVAGNDSGVGIYFVSASDTNRREKVSGHLAENAANKLIGMIPALEAGDWKVEVETQFTGSSNTFLKAPRVIEGSFTLTVAQEPPVSKD
ncbi:MAG: DUF4469 domain-containing protein [Treponema sp.]|jgi:hypothetical protein|nr:DUF4469 domain-containing protein [Treponema sp.]